MNLDTLCFDCLHSSVNYPARFQSTNRSAGDLYTRGSTLLCRVFPFPLLSPSSPVVATDETGVLGIAIWKSGTPPARSQ
jgi:hypothetical protein